MGLKVSNLAKKNLIMIEILGQNFLLNNLQSGRW